MFIVLAQSRRFTADRSGDLCLANVPRLVNIAGIGILCCACTHIRTRRPPQKTTRFEAVKVFHSPKSENLPLKIGEVRVHVYARAATHELVAKCYRHCLMQRVDAIPVPDDDFWVHATKVGRDHMLLHSKYSKLRQANSQSACPYASFPSTHAIYGGYSNTATTPSQCVRRWTPQKVVSCLGIAWR